MRTDMLLHITQRLDMSWYTTIRTKKKHNFRVGKLIYEQ
jgi:hypothetical protein